MSEPIKVAEVDDIPDDAGLIIEKDVTGTDDNIALFRDENGVYALDDTCTHEVASLADGWVEDGMVECPIHSSRFCLRDGTVQGLPATRDVKCHKVEVRDGEVWLFPNQEPVA